MPDHLPNTALAFQKVDEYTKHVIKGSAKNGRHATCEKGCFHCCKEPVHATRDEAQYLVSNLSDSERLAIREKVQSWWDTFVNQGLIGLPEIERGQGYAALLHYRSKNLYCPLLENGCCIAYKVRPISCRMHLVSGPAKLCADDLLRPNQVFIQTDKEKDFLKYLLSIQYFETNIMVVEFDHLGVWLAHLLLGETKRSAIASEALLNRGSE